MIQLIGIDHVDNIICSQLLLNYGDPEHIVDDALHIGERVRPLQSCLWIKSRKPINRLVAH